MKLISSTLKRTMTKDFFKTATTPCMDLKTTMNISEHGHFSASGQLHWVIYQAPSFVLIFFMNIFLAFNFSCFFSRINFSRICINSRLFQFHAKPDPLLLENTKSKRSGKDHFETDSLFLKLISPSFQWCGEQCWEYLASRRRPKTTANAYLTIIP